MTPLQIVVALCKLFEGFYALPYLCPAGVPTIGYGATHYLDGRPVRLTDPAITQAEAEALLLASLQRNYFPAALLASPILRQHPRRLAAVVDFVFNLGIGQYRSSTLRRRIAAGDWEGAAVEIMRWVRGGGRILPGLVKRRGAERVYLDPGLA